MATNRHLAMDPARGVRGAAAADGRHGSCLLRRPGALECGRRFADRLREGVPGRLFFMHLKGESPLVWGFAWSRSSSSPSSHRHAYRYDVALIPRGEDNLRIHRGGSRRMLGRVTVGLIFLLLVWETSWRAQGGLACPDGPLPREVLPPFVGHLHGVRPPRHRRRGVGLPLALAARRTGVRGAAGGPGPRDPSSRDGDRMRRPWCSSKRRSG